MRLHHGTSLQLVLADPRPREPSHRQNCDSIQKNPDGPAEALAAIAQFPVRFSADWTGVSNPGGYFCHW